MKNKGDKRNRKQGAGGQREKSKEKVDTLLHLKILAWAPLKIATDKVQSNSYRRRTLEVDSPLQICL